MIKKKIQTNKKQYEREENISFISFVLSVANLILMVSFPEFFGTWEELWNATLCCTT